MTNVTDPVVIDQFSHLCAHCQPDQHVEDEQHGHEHFPVALYHRKLVTKTRDDGLGSAELKAEKWKKGK